MERIKPSSKVLHPVQRAGRQVSRSSGETACLNRHPASLFGAGELTPRGAGGTVVVAAASLRKPLHVNGARLVCGVVVGGTTSVRMWCVFSEGRGGLLAPAAQCRRRQARLGHWAGGGQVPVVGVLVGELL